MAKIGWDVGLNLLPQSAQGSINTTVRDSTTIVEANGGILGHPDSGEGRSGISFSTARGLVEKADVTGSLTKQPSNFITEEIEGFSVSIPLKGNGATATGTPAHAESTPLNGVDAILNAIGLDGDNWGGGVGYVYTPNNAGVIYCTAQLFVGEVKWTLLDCVASGSISFSPGGIGILTANFAVGSVSAYTSGLTFPASPAYGTQATLSAPDISGVNHTWSTARGFSSFELTIENGIESVADSNQAVGKVQAQTARSISASVTMYGTAAADSFEHAEMIKETAPTDLLSFTAGSAMSAASTINAYTLALTNPETRSITPRRLGNQLAYDIELQAVETVADTEFELRFI